MYLSLDQKTFINENHKILNSYTIFRRKFCKQFNKKTAPTRNTYLNIINKFKKLGTVENRAKPVALGQVQQTQKLMRFAI